MKNFLLLFVCLGLFACGPAASSEAGEKTASAQAIELPAPRQWLLVLAEDWDASAGQLYGYQAQGDEWEVAWGPLPVVVGRKGLAWGRGEVPIQGLPGPVKREGDRKSPAGVFALGEAFGYAPADSAAWLAWPYLPITAGTMCIEDTASAAYNQLVDESTTAGDWTSTDHMQREDHLYQWGVFVHHNYPEPQPGAGSCIFLHLWRDQASAGTAGCTAMSQETMLQLLRWLDPAQSPQLIQLPLSAYEAYSARHPLPPLSR